MLSDRERRTLARIERHLVESDPDLARLFATAATRRPGGSTPRFLLFAGLALIVLGSIVATVPVVITGMMLALIALFTAYASPAGFGYAGTA